MAGKEEDKDRQGEGPDNKKIGHTAKQEKRSSRHKPGGSSWEKKLGNIEKLILETLHETKKAREENREMREFWGQKLDSSVEQRLKKNEDVKRIGAELEELRNRVMKGDEARDQRTELKFTPEVGAGIESPVIAKVQKIRDKGGSGRGKDRMVRKLAQDVPQEERIDEEHYLTRLQRVKPENVMIICGLDTQDYERMELGHNKMG